MLCVLNRVLHVLKWTLLVLNRMLDVLNRMKKGIIRFNSLYGLFSREIGYLTWRHTVNPRPDGVWRVTRPDGGWPKAPLRIF